MLSTQRRADPPRRRPVAALKRPVRARLQTATAAPARARAPAQASRASPSTRRPGARQASTAVTALITRYGVLGVFLLMVPESACIPVPSEVTLLFSGFAVHQGWLSFPLAVLGATAGNLVGSLIAYGVGASGLLNRVPIARSRCAARRSSSTAAGQGPCS